MVPWLRVLEALQRTRVQFPAPKWWFATNHNSGSKRSYKPASDHLGHKAHRWYTYIFAAKTFIHMK